MRATILLGLIASLTTLGAAAPQKRATCNIDLHGSNSEGGGGPGQVPINNNAWGLTIKGGANGDYFKSISTEGGGFDFSVGKDEYGGSKNMNFQASWDFGGNSWINCQVSYDGGAYISTDHQNHIDSGTVSVSNSDCYWDFDC